MIAAFLLLAGEAAHAYLNFGEGCCAEMHQAGHASDTGDDESSPAVPEHCCHNHVTLHGFALPMAAIFGPHVLGELVSVGDQSVPEPPVREIDHPPQLA